MNDLTKKLFEEMSKNNMGKKVQIPPPAIKGLEGTLLAHIPGKSIQWSFPIKESYNNPFGITFGGYYGMFSMQQWALSLVWRLRNLRLV